MRSVIRFILRGMGRDHWIEKWDYRYERWMLTPLYRTLIRKGIPLAIGATAVAIVFSDDARRQSVADLYANTKREFQQRPEFMLSAMAVDGVSAELAAEVRAVLPYDFPLSSFDVDLEDGRARVEAIPAVQDATLRIKPGGVIEVSIVARNPVAVWRQNENLFLIDGDGMVIDEVASRADRPDLPLIAGDGAKDALDEAMEIFAAAGPLTTRMRGLVRMGERRWDVIMDHDQRILLPTDNAVTAFERVIVMQQSQDLLQRDVAVVDMRNDDRPTLRLGETGAAEMRRINAVVAGAGR
ncbi:cell division protein FtsQ [Marivivens niveibacter]|uniref:Cell division protein FtsQ n=1 Tax=Marivivens niveibacter TaxID=1930667 RepID=A0A251WWL4_9RHOB|nr:cell division protein FtsQ/DivIB [Marivivens niveibacter]OUD08762.1 cell division protein FtsQ [Marivivens niveibacter]